MRMRASSFVWVLLLACACGDDASTTAGGGAGASGGSGGSGGALAGGGGAGGQAQPVPFDGTAPTCVVTDDPTAPAVCCPDESLRALPESAVSVLDLSDAAAIEEGTCGTYYDEAQPGTRRSVALPLSPSSYPLKIVLPALDGPDPACEVTCGGAEPVATTFGVALRTGSVENGYVIGGDTGRVLAISVPPPWFFVSGGCGEACPWPCLEGYQEFGVRSCYTMAYGDFGFATADPSAPSVEAVVELLDVGEEAFELAPGGCCLFGASARNSP